MNTTSPGPSQQRGSTPLPISKAQEKRVIKPGVYKTQTITATIGNAPITEPLRITMNKTPTKKRFNSRQFLRDFAEALSKLPLPITKYSRPRPTSNHKRTQRSYSPFEDTMEHHQSFA